VTADELEPHRRGDRLELELEVLVNGVRIGGDTLASMAWSFEDLAAYASRGTWVRTGDVLGVGNLRRWVPRRPLGPGGTS
jgi:2-keto-4-pentenoate hydratase/2-oxohepta-3-ene-1,7-dioic acid hydratase in catechol pathway